jgi:hypothetical protein
VLVMTVPGSGISGVEVPVGVGSSILAIGVVWDNSCALVLFHPESWPNRDRADIRRAMTIMRAGSGGNGLFILMVKETQ